MPACMLGFLAFIDIEDEVFLMFVFSTSCSSSWLLNFGILLVGLVLIFFLRSRSWFSLTAEIIQMLRNTEIIPEIVNVFVLTLILLRVRHSLLIPSKYNSIAGPYESRKTCR